MNGKDGDRARNEFDFFFGAAAYIALYIATDIRFPALANLAGLLTAGALIEGLRPRGWRFWAALALAPMLAMALMWFCTAVFAWLTGMASPEETSAMWGWSLFTLLTFGPVLAFNLFTVRAALSRKGAAG